MPLHSASLSGDERLEACLVKDSAHWTPDVRGEFVAKVQAALIYLDKLTIDEEELKTQAYGPSTAAAVLAFKKKQDHQFFVPEARGQHRRQDDNQGPRR